MAQLIKPKLTIKDAYAKTYRGELTITVRDRNGRIVQVIEEPNLIKIFAKEILSHRMPYSKVWDPSGGSGSGAWITSTIDPNEEFAAKYILLGASFDSGGAPLDVNDSRYYTLDPVTGDYIPKLPVPGADNFGDLINPIPISEPYRPLKRIETISFESSYQPADSPLLDETVRAMNNVTVLETVLKLDEYNGMGTSTSDYFTITEIALAAGREITTTGACECTPHVLFLEGASGLNNSSIYATAASGSTISITPSTPTADVNRIKQGDQILIVAQAGSAETYDTLDQLNPYYLVVTKNVGGRDVTLDRTPTNIHGQALTGSIGIYRSTLRLFSQRILSTPFKKSNIYEITITWRIIFA